MSFVTLALAFLKDHWRVVGLTTVIAALGFALVAKNLQLSTARQQLAQCKAEIVMTAAQTAVKQAMANEVASTVKGTHQAEAERVRIEYLTIEKKVPIYVTKADDANCVVPESFSVLWNAQNRGDASELVEPRRSADETTSGAERDAP